MSRAVRLTCAIALALLARPPAASAAEPSSWKEPSAWTAPHAPFRIGERTWYVGTEGITVLVVRGDAGSILVDTGTNASAESVLDSLQRIGVAPGEIRAIVTSHAHSDHTGAIAALKARTGATVHASAASATLLADGGRNDLHFGDDLPYPPVQVDARIGEGEAVVVGNVSLTAHSTPAHTPGSTTWTWVDTIDGAAVSMVYADSLTAPGYRLLGHPRSPTIVDDFRRGFAAIRALDCDVLMTPHPEASRLFERVATGTLVDATACARYADRAQEALDAQIAKQASAK